MCSLEYFESAGASFNDCGRSQSAQGLTTIGASTNIKIPLPPRLWITDYSDNTSDENDCQMKDDTAAIERVRVRSRYRLHKQRNLNIPTGIFWDIENCPVPRGCSAIDVVAAIRAKFLNGRREADFVVVCDARKESPQRLQELNDAQINLIHVCGTQKNAADEKLRQCIRRFGEMHSAPATLLLISGDINFAADLSDFRHRKNMEVILVHKQNTSSALIACASSHYCYNELTENLPRNPKRAIQTDGDEELACEMEVDNLPVDKPPHRVSCRLKRLADNCGGKVVSVTASTALLRFSTPELLSRAVKRMDGQDVYGCKIITRCRSNGAPVPQTYSSDEGYSTAPTAPTALTAPISTTAPYGPTEPTAPSAPYMKPPAHQLPLSAQRAPYAPGGDWALALQQLPTHTPQEFCLPAVPKPRIIRGTHGSISLDRSGCSSSNSGDDTHRDINQGRAISPWDSSASFSEQSEGDSEPVAELSVSNLPPQDTSTLQKMIAKLFSQYVSVLSVTVWIGLEGPQATVVVRSEWDARLAIARIHKRKLQNKWLGRKLELSLGKPSPAPNADVLRARLRAILLDQDNHALPLLRLRDAYANRYACALTTSDIAKLRDTVIIYEGMGRLVQLVDHRPVLNLEIEGAPWKCNIHAPLSACHEDGSRILQPVFIEIAALTENVKKLLENHGGVIPLLTFVECYEATFSRLVVDEQRGVPLELLLRSAPELQLLDAPARHLVLRPTDSPAHQHSHGSHCGSVRSEGSRGRARGRTAPSLEPMLALFERELIDLLRSKPRCVVPFSKLIPDFHHHFGRQCRVADYGFTKLPDLLAVLTDTIEVLGSGSHRVITISAAAQARRWTSDLVKLLKAHPARAIMPQEIGKVYQTIFERPFSPVHYGVCTFRELMQRVEHGAVAVAPDGALSLPRRSPTPVERARAVQFAAEILEMLRFTPNLRLDFSRFVPAYHAHFERQLRVGHFGCVKLIELLEMIPETVTVLSDANEERTIMMSRVPARIEMGRRLQALSGCALEAFPGEYARMFGAPPQPDVVGAHTPAGLVLATGGAVVSGAVRAPGDAPLWVSAELGACAALSADRSVAARGSALDYFASTFRRVAGSAPPLLQLSMAGVVQVAEGRVRLTPAWRTVWRVALILDDMMRLTANDVAQEYTKRFEPEFPCIELDVPSVTDFLQCYHEVFAEEYGRWSLRAGIHVPRLADAAPPPEHDYTAFDTPPGQKGSRVFELPAELYCSPPASALPTPSALLSQEKRRTRLAAHFNDV